MSTPIPNAAPGNYAVSGNPAVDLECSYFDEVTHITHLESAARVIADGKIRADLVFDTSRLNTERIRVVWLSPNTWVNGYRYGGTAFRFDWKLLVQQFHRFYWVEAMAYSPPAPRILLTKKNRSSLGLQPYDPTTGNGPWWWDKSNDLHYFNRTLMLATGF